MKKGWAIYSENTLKNGSHAFDMMRGAAADCGVTLEVMFAERLKLYTDKIYYESKSVDCPDFAVMRCYNAECSYALENIGVRVINSTESMLLSLNKMETYRRLTENGIPTPFSVEVKSVGYDYGQISSVMDSGKFVVKGMRGSKGEQVYLVEDECSMSEAVEMCDGDCLAQKFILDSYGRDIRVWVIGDKAVGAVMRYNESSFKSNFSAGGSAKLFEITTESALLAVNASRSLGLEFSGVDLLYDKDSFTVCEVNGNAGFRTISSLSDINIPKLLFEYITR